MSWDVQQSDQRKMWMCVYLMKMEITQAMQRRVNYVTGKWNQGQLSSILSDEHENVRRSRVMIRS